MPSITWEPEGYGGKYVIYESPVVGPYKVLAIIAVIFAAFVIGALVAADKSCK